MANLKELQASEGWTAYHDLLQRAAQRYHVALLTASPEEALRLRERVLAFHEASVLVPTILQGAERARSLDDDVERRTAAAAASARSLHIGNPTFWAD